MALRWANRKNYHRRKIATGKKCMSFFLYGNLCWKIAISYTYVIFMSTKFGCAAKQNSWSTRRSKGRDKTARDKSVWQNLFVQIVLKKIYRKNIATEQIRSFFHLPFSFAFDKKTTFLCCLLSLTWPVIVSPYKIHINICDVDEFKGSDTFHVSL